MNNEVKKEEKTVLTEQKIEETVKKSFLDSKKAMIVTAGSLLGTTGLFVLTKKLVKRIKAKKALEDDETVRFKFPWKKSKKMKTKMKINIL